MHDLAGLQRDDLRELGLTMAERSRVLRWNAEAKAGRRDDELGSVPWESPSRDKRKHHAGTGFHLLHKVPDCAASCALRAVKESPVINERKESWQSSDSVTNSDPIADTDGAWGNTATDIDERLLDEVEQDASFWIGLVATAKPVLLVDRGGDSEYSGPSHAVTALSDQAGSEAQTMLSDFDVRENVLEMLFDLTPERVKEVYDGIDRDADGCISAAELGRGLQRYRLPELSIEALTQVRDVVTAQQRRWFSLAEFEAVLSRLKLAQLLRGTLAERDPFGGVCQYLNIVDYGISGAFATCVTAEVLRDFFFGHRPREHSDPRRVRWVHTSRVDLIVILALTVKYGLHPLSVEDVIEQCPTKIDRNGEHYFVAIEQLCLVGCHDGSSPVRVQGRHVTVFCAGPPRVDTIITIAQPDRSFAVDWPGGVSHDAGAAENTWVERLQDRLKAPLSRLRERGSDFLMHQVIDLCTDELVAVTRAYTKRLGRLEVELHECGAKGLPADWRSEPLIIRLQLTVVTRRIRGLQRLLRHIVEDSDLTAGGLCGYFQDVTDHLNEAHDDAGLLVDRCVAITNAFEHHVERNMERVRQRSADRLNRMVFVLTVATVIFAPMQLCLGVYGISFADSEIAPKNRYGLIWALAACYIFITIAGAVHIFRRLHKGSGGRNGLLEGEDIEDKLSDEPLLYSINKNSDKKSKAAFGRIKSQCCVQ